MLKNPFEEVKPATLQTVDSIGELVKYLHDDRQATDCSSVHNHLNVVNDWLNQTPWECKISGNTMLVLHVLLGLLLFGPDLFEILTELPFSNR